MKNDYKTTKDWDEDLEGLIEGEPSLEKLRYWAIRIQIVYADRAKTSCVVCYNATDAIEVIEAYLRNTTKYDVLAVVKEGKRIGTVR